MKSSIGLLFFCVLSCAKLTAQLDTSFWFVAPEVTSAHGDNPTVFRFATMNEPATIVVSQPANPAFPIQTLNLLANASQTLNLQNWLNLVENAPSNTVLNKGFRITSTTPISAYYEVNPACQCNPDIMALKGANALGTSFVVGGQTFFANDANYSPRADAKFDIVATEDNTNITIIPSVNIMGHAAGVPFTITLNAGQTWSGVSVPQFGQKVVGTIINANKPIAVTYSDDSVAFNQCRDILSDQLIPISVIGTEYIAVRGFLQDMDRVFVTATQPNTDVFIDGSATPATTLQLGQTYMIELTTPSTFIQTSSPAYVFHLSGFGCEVGGAVLPPIVCTGSQEIPFIRSTNEFFGITILVPAGSEGDFLLNGAAGIIVASDFSVVPGTNNEWMYAQLNMTAQIAVNVGSRIENPSERFHFGLINGGASSGCRYGFFSDFSSTKYEIQTSQIDFCAGESIELFTNQIAGATYEWSGPNGFSAQGISIAIPNATAENAGLYLVEGYLPDACQVLADSVEISVFEIPTLQATSNVACNNVNASFQLNPDWSGNTPGNFLINFGDGTSNIFINDVINHNYTSPGSYNAEITITSAEGCESITDIPIQIFASPVAQISSSAICSSTVDFNAQVMVPQNTLNIEQQFWLVGGDSIIGAAPSYNFDADPGDYTGVFGIVLSNNCMYTFPFSYFVDNDVDIENVQLPNIITPNDDGINDKFFIDELFESCTEYTIEFFNRWGELVYTMTSNAKAFEGKDDIGNTLTKGVYFYKLNTPDLEKHGFVHVVRE